MTSFRFVLRGHVDAVAGLRSLMYFGGKGALSQSLYVLGGMAAAAA
ncbi:MULTISPECIES: hypothetical protein [unclassified Paenibacillus]|nr:hypothetical protein [Paenibacillus sp. MAHUQ-63]